MLFRPNKSHLSNKSKKWKFSNGVSPSFLFQKIELYTMCAVWGNPARKDLFYIYSGWKRVLFWPEKKSFKKIQKNLNFPEGLFHGFFQNIEFLTMRIKPEKNVFWYSGLKKEWFWEKKSKVLKKSRKSKFSKGVSPWFLSKNRTFYHVCFLGKSGQKTSFLDILDRKECFLDQSKWSFKQV